MSSLSIFRSAVSEGQASTIRERITKAGLEVQYQEEQHGAILVLVMKFKSEHAHAVRDVLAAVGITLAGDELSA